MLSTGNNTIRTALLATTPVMAGYIVVGFAFGLLMQTSGYSIGWVILMGILIYSGSMQFVCISFLGGLFGWPQIVLIALAMNIRHMVYGLSFIETFHSMGKSRLYMMYSLTDETYSLLCSKKDSTNSSTSLLFWISFLNQSYWLIGGMFGNLFGQILTFNTKGIEFAMTALFFVSFLDQIAQATNRKSALVGMCFSLISLLLFGKDSMILPALTGIIVVLLWMRRQSQRGAL